MASSGPALPPSYEFVRPLGAGGFGEVVLARHRSIGRLVAVKRIHEHALADAEAIERFRREARVLAATSCSSVVRVYDLLTSDKGAQLVMEYCPGESLAELLNLGPLSASDGLVVLQDVADALAAMAERGIIHRDVKPGNVFVLLDGHAKLGDFGLARVVADSSAFRTAGGPAMGTPAYFPPEVSQGVSQPDELSDAYSFAVMAYETLTGKRPFDAPDALSLITAHWKSEPLPAAAAMPGFPDAAWRILQRGLDKDPAGRLLPIDLVARLKALPESNWPAVQRRQAEAPTRRSDPTVRQPGFMPGSSTQTSPQPSHSLARLRQRRFPAVQWPVLALLAIALTAGLIIGIMSTQDPRLEVASVRVQVDPSSGTATCPRGSFVFTAVLMTNGSPGTLRLQWARPDGATTRTVQVKVGAGQREVRAKLPFTIRGPTPLEGNAEIRVLSPEVLSAHRSVRYDCPQL